MLKKDDEIAYLLTDDSFLRWINDKSNAAERQKWEQWLEEDPANIYIARQSKELIQSLQFEEEHPDTGKELNKLQKALTIRESSGPKIHPGQKYSPYWPRAAAIIALIIMVLAAVKYGGWEIQQPQNTEASTKTVQTNYGEIKKLALSDGSQITLNAHSKLTYPAVYKGGDMEVDLQGEAYFSIVHKTGKQQRTFSVHTSQGRIAVLGTRFNVNTYSKDTEVVLEKGKVHVETVDTSGAVNRDYMMKPGELAQLKFGAAEIEVKKVDTKLYTSWTNLELKFKNTSLREIAKRIEQLYGVSVEFRKKGLEKVKFSGSAPNKKLIVLLEGLRTLLDIPIIYKKNTITIGG